MILYHFTARTFLPRIEAQGLTRGIVPWCVDRATGDVMIRRGLQWLTTNDKWHQEWMVRGSIPFSRNSIRLTIWVPATHQHRVANWDELAKRHGVESAEDLNRGCDHENWRLYLGKLPPVWIVATDRNPAEILRPDLPDIDLS